MIKLRSIAPTVESMLVFGLVLSSMAISEKVALTLGMVLGPFEDPVTDNCGYEVDYSQGIYDGSKEFACVENQQIDQESHREPSEQNGKPKKDDLNDLKNQFHGKLPLVNCRRPTRGQG